MSHTKTFDAKYWVKVRNSINEESIFLAWSGRIYALIPREGKHHLFNMVGMNVSRSLDQGDGRWEFTSRELTYYLDPDTHEILHRWRNPWSGEVLTVVHVANNPVQGTFEGEFPVTVEKEFSTFVFEVFSHYDNPLSGDQRFTHYSSSPIYQSVDLFKLTVPTTDLQNPMMTSLPQVILSWDRVGPWLPWMKMGDRTGQLIYSGVGRKLASFEELPPILKSEINTRIPIYREAPSEKVAGENITSWRYFKKHFEAYLAGERFPLPESA